MKTTRALGFVVAVILSPPDFAVVAAPPAPTVPASTICAIDYSPLATPDGGLLAGKILVSLKSQDGSSYSRTFTAAPGTTDLKPLVKTIVVNLMDSGWDASVGGNSVIIRGHINQDRTVNPVKEVQCAQDGLAAKYQPKIILGADENAK
jgi:hypothetical protein